jgi:hypothetical protein
MGQNIMKLIILALPLLFPVHAFAGTTESTLQYILDDYQALSVVRFFGTNVRLN